MTKKLRLNGKEVDVIGNQIVFDFDFDILGNAGEQAEPLPEPVFKPRQKPVCNCGAKHVKIQPYMQGHSDWCDVHESKTPVM